MERQAKGELMRFTAKVKVTDIVPQGDQSRVTFGANYGDSTGNEEWAKYTPWLKYEKNIRGELADRLEVGQTFTVLFTLDDDGEAKDSDQRADTGAEQATQQEQVENARDTEQAPPEAFGQAEAQAEADSTTER